MGTLGMMHGRNSSLNATSTPSLHILPATMSSLLLHSSHYFSFSLHSSPLHSFTFSLPNSSLLSVAIAAAAAQLPPATHRHRPPVAAGRPEYHQFLLSHSLPNFDS